MIINMDALPSNIVFLGLSTSTYIYQKQYRTWLEKALNWTKMAENRTYIFKEIISPFIRHHI